MIRMSGTCAYGTSTTCHYLGVVVVVMNSIAWHIVLTRNDSTNESAGKCNARTGMCSNFTENMFTWDDIGHIHRFIDRFSVVGL